MASGEREVVVYKGRAGYGVYARAGDSRLSVDTPSRAVAWAALERYRREFDRGVTVSFVNGGSRGDPLEERALRELFGAEWKRFFEE